MLTKSLVRLDGTPESKVALRIALTLAWATNARVMLLRVVQGARVRGDSDQQAKRVRLWVESPQKLRVLVSRSRRLCARVNQLRKFSNLRAIWWWT
jgi:hypothetical protein